MPIPSGKIDTWLLQGTVNSVLLNFRLSVCFYILLNSLPYSGPTHMLFSHLVCFYYFYSLFYYLLLVGFTHAIIALEFIHVRLVYSTWLPYAVERGPSL